MAHILMQHISSTTPKNGNNKKKRWSNLRNKEWSTAAFNTNYDNNNKKNHHINAYHSTLHYSLAAAAAAAMVEQGKARTDAEKAASGGKGRLRQVLRRAEAQIVVIALVCFCCPGMFNALAGMGGGGQLNPQAADDANTALYAAFAVFGLVGGAAFNVLGPACTTALGSTTYIVYAASFLYYNHRRSATFPTVAGGLLGVGAGLLWATQGAIMTAYPMPAARGRSISVFWCIFNLGGVLGGFIPFALNFHRRSAVAGSVNDGTYIAFMIVMGAGTLLSLLLLPPRTVRRSDGTAPAATAGPSPAPCTEAKALAKVLCDWRMILMLVPSVASNYFYTYQFNNVNARLFNVRSRGLNNVLYWAAQMLGSALLGGLLDLAGGSRRRRALLGLAAVGAVLTAVWAGSLANQLRYRRSFAGAGGLAAGGLDFRERVAAPVIVLYASFGLVDAMFQTLAYWTMGALADDAATLSRYAGFYKSFQSAGAAVAWQSDKHSTALLTELIVNWSLVTASLPLLGLLMVLGIPRNEKTPTPTPTFAASPLSRSSSSSPPARPPL